MLSWSIFIEGERQGFSLKSVAVKPIEIPSVAKGSAVRVLHITSGLQEGGAESTLYRLVCETHEDALGVVSLTFGGNFLARLERKGVQCTQIDLRQPGMFFTNLARLVQYIRAVKPDTVQTWMYHANIIGGFAARIARVPKIVWGLHSASLDKAYIGKSANHAATIGSYLSWILPDDIVCASKAVELEHVRLGYCRSKMKVVLNGVDLDYFKPQPLIKKQWRDKLGAKESHFLIGMVARWDPVKDHTSLVKAFAKLIHERGLTSARIILAGQGASESNMQLQELLQQNDVASRCICLGPCDDVAALMNALDVLVLPSLTEALGNVIIEAMACGTPCVVSDIGMSAEIVGSSGWVVPPSAPTLLADALETAFQERNDMAEWNARARSARALIAERFGQTEMIDGYRRIWKEKH